MKREKKWRAIGRVGVVCKGCRQSEKRSGGKHRKEKMIKDEKP